MQIRPATIPDLAAIVACADLAFESFAGSSADSDDHLPGDLTALVLDGSIHLICDGGESLGYISLWPIADHLFVDTIAVLPKHQGHGLGGRLLSFAEGEAARLGLRSIRLFTKEKMSDNLAFYQRHGYRETDRCGQDGYPRVFYRKDIAPRLAAAMS